MDEAKKRRLEEAGFKTGTVEEFLQDMQGMTDLQLIQATILALLKVMETSKSCGDNVLLGDTVAKLHNCRLVLLRKKEEEAKR